MYFYSIGYHSHEDSCYVQYTHEQFFTKEQLHKIVGDALFQVLISLKKPTLTHYDTRVEDLMFHGEFVDGDQQNRKVFSEYLKSLGFVPVKYDGDVSLFGWCSATDPKDWDRHQSEEQMGLADVLRKRLMDAGVFTLTETEECLQEDGILVIFAETEI